MRKDLTARRTRLCAVLLILLPIPCALAEDARAGMIQQYGAECSSINTERGLAAQRVEALCACETRAIETHFAAFAGMVSEAQDAAPPSEAEARALREAIRQCQADGG